MNIDDLTLGQIKQLKSMLGGSCKDDEKDMMYDFIGKKVIIRDNKAGVFVRRLKK